MRLGMLADFFLDIKNWIYGWDSVTFSLILIIIGLFLAVLVISFLKTILKADKPKFKFSTFFFIALLVAILVIILVIRV